MKKKKSILLVGIAFALTIGCLNLTAKSEFTKSIANINSVNLVLFASETIAMVFVVALVIFVANRRHLKFASFAGLTNKIYSKVVVHAYGISNGARKKDQNSPDVAEDATPASEMQKQVERGQAPKEVKRVDSAHGSSGQPHVHFKDGTALNRDGSIHYND